MTPSSRTVRTLLEPSPPDLLVREEEESLPAEHILGLLAGGGAVEGGAGHGDPLSLSVVEGLQALFFITNELRAVGRPLVLVLLLEGRPRFFRIDEFA